eukprot:TRINITY_DN398_c0_g1_i3.p1 TRINITY_DN398_c0_g1~~TRINITY_DN398_c0_g1_i3.p1  ORF type:complete len:154 (-),score=9.26 TRINITY_DN398_c0_g1_i3:19-480(-)
MSQEGLQSQVTSSLHTIQLTVERADKLHTTLFGDEGDNMGIDHFPVATNAKLLPAEADFGVFDLGQLIGLVHLLQLGTEGSLGGRQIVLFGSGFEGRSLVGLQSLQKHHHLGSRPTLNRHLSGFGFVVDPELGQTGAVISQGGVELGFPCTLR